MFSRAHCPTHRFGAGALPFALFCATLIIGASVNADPFRLDLRVPCDTSRLQGAPDPPPPYRNLRVFERLKLTRPVHVTTETGTDRLLVVEHDGRVLAFRDDPATDTCATFLELTGYETYSIALHPDYANNGQVFVFAHGARGAPPPPYNRIYRFEAKGSPRVCDPASRQLVIEWASNGHSGGDLLFGPEGFLYITSGDGTAGSDGDLTGQDLRDLCSGVLRIDVDRPRVDTIYSVPADNPFLRLKDARPELYAFGLRNPWRMALDPSSGTMWIADVGQDSAEMIFLLQRGGNYGWSVYEGSRPFYPKRRLGPGPVLPPAVEHPHAEARSITGGAFYRGVDLPELKDTYLYGDYATGRIWGLRHEKGKVIWNRVLANTRLQIVGFGRNHAGSVLIVDYAGQLHRLEPAVETSARDDWPRKLSETGLFLSTAEYRPQPGLIPYTVNSPLWSDGAAKERHIAMPGETAMTFTEGGAWQFPEGTVLVKTFSLEREAGNPASRRRVETRLLTFQLGDWQAYSYRWDDAETDAELVSGGGLDRQFSIADPQAPGGTRTQTWHYPSRAECMVCHVRAGFVLGLNTPQINKIHDYGEIRENQLVALMRLGALRIEGRSDLPRPPDGYQRLVDPYDPAGPPADRARSYLHANCAHCHVDEGGGNSAIDLHFTTTAEKMRLFDVKPAHDAFELSDARLIVPGVPDRSVLLHRVATTHKGRMPPLASSVVDEAAVRLLREWIRQLQPRETPLK